MAEVVVPRVPRDHRVWVCPAVVAWERGVQLLVAVLFGELRAVHPGRVTAALRVDVEPRLADVPFDRVHVNVSLKKQNLMRFRCQKSFLVELPQ